MIKVSHVLLFALQSSLLVCYAFVPSKSYSHYKGTQNFGFCFLTECKVSFHYNITLKYSCKRSNHYHSAILECIYCWEVDRASQVDKKCSSHDKQKEN